MKSRTLDMDALMRKVRHKVEVLDRALDFPSDRCAAQALAIPPSTIRKWQRQADFSSRRALILSLGGIPGRKTPKVSKRLQFDEYEGQILSFAGLFPEWNEFGIANALRVLGHKVPVEDIRLVLRGDRIRRGLEEPCSPQIGINDPPEEQAIDESALLDIVFERMLAKFIEERPLRAGFFVTEVAQDMAGWGRELVRICRSLNLESGIDIDGYERQCKDLQKQAQMVRRTLLAPFKTRGVEASEDSKPGQQREDFPTGGTADVASTG